MALPVAAYDAGSDVTWLPLPINLTDHAESIVHSRTRKAITLNGAEYFCYELSKDPMVVSGPGFYGHWLFFFSSSRQVKEYYELLSLTIQSPIIGTSQDPISLLISGIANEPR